MTKIYSQFYLGNINAIDFWLIYIPYMLQLIKRKQEETMIDAVINISNKLIKIGSNIDDR